MLRIFALCAVALILAHASPLDEKITNLIGEANYKKNKNFIAKIFAKEQNYYNNYALDIERVLAELTTNGLLSLRLKKPESVEITFSAKVAPALLIRAINHLLSSMGYSYFEPVRASFADGVMRVTYGFVAESTPDPLIIVDELKARGFALADVTRGENKTQWEYSLVLGTYNHPTAKKISRGGSASMREVSGEYWVALSGVGTLEISAKTKSFLRVVLYDGELRVMDSYESEKARSQIDLKIPQGVKFVMITDAKNPQNLKTGLSVWFKK